MATMFEGEKDSDESKFLRIKKQGYISLRADLLHSGTKICLPLRSTILVLLQKVLKRSQRGCLQQPKLSFRYVLDKCLLV